MASKTKLAIAGLGVYGAMTGATYLWFKDRKREEISARNTNITEQQRNDAVSLGAKRYDNDIAWDETMMFLPVLRWWMIRKASGKVLETSFGTGRNLSYYSSDCELNAVDINPEMLEVANEKISKMKDKLSNVSLTVVTAEKLPFPDNYFDVVVDTFGLCSIERPEMALAEMGRVCKPDGKILLLEHGQGHYDFINNALDNGAHAHAKKWGCWWNRPIGDIIDNCDLNVASISRFHFGTTWMVEAQPPNTSKSKSLGV
eukprot:m.17007 g.17007  ORF g.17007 m.17007 type:complete len:258 (+) comp5869_c0_seq1:51-824(+)